MVELFSVVSDFHACKLSAIPQKLLIWFTPILPISNPDDQLMPLIIYECPCMERLADSCYVWSGANKVPASMLSIFDRQCLFKSTMTSLFLSCWSRWYLILSPQIISEEESESNKCLQVSSHCSARPFQNRVTTCRLDGKKTSTGQEIWIISNSLWCSSLINGGYK